ncbi:MAG: hypothetical protein V4686_00485 [Patescibacteria group bacterium]
MFLFIMEKIFDLVAKLLWIISKKTFNFLSPLIIYPKKTLVGDFTSIQTLQIINRSGQNLYDIYVAGMSREIKGGFDIKIVSSNIPNAKTVEYTKINTNAFVVIAQDPKTKIQLWIYRIHHMEPRAKIEIKLKIKSSKPVYFKNLGFSYKEIFIKEWSNGSLNIPFTIKKLPNIKE